MKPLILVESPTKAKTLTRFLGGKYNIQASMGHIRDLPKGNLGVDIENNFEPKYVIPKDKRKTIESLKADAKEADVIILATDPDREGEAISFHLKEVLTKEVPKGAKFQRIVFHEITPRAINEALENPHDIDMNLVAAQTGRRILDRVVGYKLSPILWMKIKKGLSAGRVQSIALRLIVEREREIGKFTNEEFYRVAALLTKDNKNPVLFELVKINGEAIEKTNTLKLYDGEYKSAKTSLSKTDSESIRNDLDGKTFTVLDVAQKETKRSPYPPFTTSLLQIEASRRFGYPSKRTMSLAQRLYEEGFITYHRTDSFNLSADFLGEARTFIEKNYGKKYLPDAARTYQTKSKLAQEAHEAIRPTNLFEDENSVAAKLGKDFAKLYNLIYKRALATQMSDAIFLSTRIDVEAVTDKTYLFQANGRVMKFDGFLKIWFYEDPEQLIPDLSVADKLNLSELKITTHTTTPPSRYNEGSLIGSLEKHGIGRPSTYAPTISTITARFYVEKDENRFKPTEIGTLVNDFLVKNFAEIDDIPFTADMENKLDEIASGKTDWVPVVKEFYKPFEKDLKLAEGEEKIKIELEKTGEKCPLDGGDVVIRVGRFGKFKACANFPECKFRESIVQESGYLCPRDAGKMVLKKTHKGRTFYGCGNYPKCDFAVWTKEQLEKDAVPATPAVAQAKDAKIETTSETPVETPVENS